MSLYPFKQSRSASFILVLLAVSAALASLALFCRRMADLAVTVPAATVPLNVAFSFGIYSDWPDFQVHSAQEPSVILRCCGNGHDSPSIGKLLEILEAWQQSPDPVCSSHLNVFKSMYRVKQERATLAIPSKLFQDKVKKWLGYDNRLYSNIFHQEITTISNKYTYDTSVFNPLRSKRPITKTTFSERAYVENLSSDTAPECDFCKYKQYTAEDTFGRLESAYAFTAANAFKYDVWHSMVISRSHHPLNWTMAEFMDIFYLAQRWIQRVHEKDGTAVYPMLLWDLLPHAGASQVHPHVHVNIDSDAYLGIPESWRAAAERYHLQNGGNYFSALLSVHSALGLAVPFGTAAAIAVLTPKKENEIIILGRQVDNDFLQLLYFTLRAYIDDMESLCFSMSLVYPPLKPGTPGTVPAFARIVTRGSAQEIRSDVSSLELLGPSNVNQDPFKLIRLLRNSVTARSS